MKKYTKVIGWFICGCGAGLLVIESNSIGVIALVSVNIFLNTNLTSGDIGSTITSKGWWGYDGAAWKRLDNP